MAKKKTKPPKPKMKTFTVNVTTQVKVTLDESLLPDDDWRASFYPIFTLSQLAERLTRTGDRRSGEVRTGQAVRNRDGGVAPAGGR